MAARKALALQKSNRLNAMLEDFPNITKEVLYDIAELLDLEDREGYITNTPIINLYNDEELLERISYKAGYPLYNDDGTLYLSSQKGIASKYLYIYMIYVYKFGSNDPFWSDNIFNFIPRYDYAVISENEKLRLLFAAIGIEFDKLEEIISKMAELQDIDKIPNEYLQYLAQLLGYEKEDFQLGDTAFREIVKNIIQIYKIKGTNYSFKFFFKFLGFDYNVIEMYFDRDRDKPGEADNKASNYLTDVDPRERFEVDPNTGDIVLAPIPPDQFTETRNLELFDFLADTASGRGIPVDVLLGKTGDFPNPFTYFKTNFLQHELTEFYQGDEPLIPRDPDVVDKIINKYIRFLTPSYIQSSINLNLTPYQDGPIPVFEDFTIEVIKNIYDIIGLNTTQQEWEQLKDTYETIETENDTKIIEPTDDSLIDVSVNTDGAPLNEEPDRIGDYIKHNGVHSRGKDSPAHIPGLKHELTFRTALENVAAEVSHPNWDYVLSIDEFNEYLRDNPWPWIISKEYTAAANQTDFPLPYVYENPVVYVYKNNVLIQEYDYEYYTDPVSGQSFVIGIQLHDPTNAGDIIKISVDKE